MKLFLDLNALFEDREIGDQPPIPYSLYDYGEDCDLGTNTK